MHYKFHTLSLQGIISLQEQQDQAITYPKVILHSARQCLHGAQPPSYVNQCFLKAITCITAASVSQHYNSIHCRCNSISLGRWPYIFHFCNFTLRERSMCSHTLESRFLYVCSITVSRAAWKSSFFKPVTAFCFPTSDFGLLPRASLYHSPSLAALCPGSSPEKLRAHLQLFLTGFFGSTLVQHSPLFFFLASTPWLLLRSHEFLWWRVDGGFTEP